MMKILKIVGVVLFFLLFISDVEAFEPSIDVTVDRKTITMDDTLQVTIEIRGGGAMTTPDIPELGNFNVVGQTSGTSIEMVNGKISTTKTFNYLLEPRNPGDFSIGPFQAHIDGKAYTAGPVRVKVMPSGFGSRYQPQHPLHPPGFPGTAPSPTAGRPGVSGPLPGTPPSEPQPPSEKRELTFITADIDKNEIFVGEQVLFTFRLYSAVNLQDAQLHLPEFKDFITEEIITERKYQTQLDGRRYAVNEWRYALFPTKSGALETGKSEVQGRVPVALRENLFEDPFFQGFSAVPTRLQSRTFSAPSLKLTVKPLPTPPSDFTGLVGQFTLQSELSKNQLNLGDTARLKITLRGKGNIGEARLPELTQDNFFKIYSDLPDVKLDKTFEGIQGTKTFNFALVAERPGTTTLKSLPLTYFDPQIQTYQTLQTPSEVILVQGTARDEKLVTAGLEEKKESLPLEKKKMFDLKEIKPLGALFHSQVLPAWSKGLAWFLFWGSPTAFLLVLFYQRRQTRILAQAEDRKRSNAFKNAKNAVARWRTGIKTGDYDELSSIIHRYLSDRFMVKGTALTPGEIEELLKEKGIPTETNRRMVYLLEQMDAWKYSGAVQSLPSPKGLKQEITQLLREIEKNL